jgi:hypothetical protein
VETVRTRRKVRSVPCDPKSLENQVRQLLADKISGNQIGIWLLLPELLRLGAWELLCGWTGRSSTDVQPRLALHLINEAALCLCSCRRGRSLSQKGFEVANGLPFVPTDLAIHQLLNAHTVEQAQRLQVALGKLRRASGHFPGQLLALDAHRIPSYSQRQMRRHRFSSQEKAKKMLQTFFLLDCESHQPVALTIASSAQTVTQATDPLLEMGAEILQLQADETPRPLLLADKEYHTQELFASVAQERLYDLLVPVPDRKLPEAQRAQIAALPFTEHWPGYATAHHPFRFSQSQSHGPELVEFVQREGVGPEIRYKRFTATAALDVLPTLTQQYPERWHIEEFFKFQQALGWDRAGTLNLNVRYGQMSLALITQAALYQMKKRLGKPVSDWDAEHLAREFFDRIEGDIRVEQNTIVVTLYNAPNAELLRAHYENLPEKLKKEGVDPVVPWLYGFQLDFRFK